MAQRLKAVIVGELTKHDRETRDRMLRYLCSWSNGYATLEQQRVTTKQEEARK